MTRRDLMKAIAAVLTVGVSGTRLSMTQPRKRYGPLSIGRHLFLQHQGIHLHVIHHGQDVTRRCTFADDTNEGMAALFLHDAAGKPYTRPVPDGEYGRYPGEREAAKEIVYGVTFVEGQPFHG